jgi:hypothetical protein
MSNSWIDHVKAYAKKHNLKYNEALKKAGPSFKKSKGSTAKTTAKGKSAKSTAKGDMSGSRLAYDDTKQEKDKKKKK